jgi:hypothetical protein
MSDPVKQCDNTARARENQCCEPNSKGRKPWKPGESGNPRGRPRKENTYSDTVRALLEATEIDVTFTTADGKTQHRRVTSSKNLYYGIAAAQIMEAMKGDTTAARELIDRVQGKPLASVDVHSSHTERREIDITARIEELESIYNERFNSIGPGKDGGSDRRNGD